jgi:ribosomal protein L20A (L18A)
VKKYRVFACYVVELYHDLEAESKDDAWDKVYQIDGSEYTVCNEDGWQIDRIEEITQGDNDYKNGGFVNAEEERVYNADMEGK